MKSKTIIQADEMLEILNKQWATVQDIMKIGAVGRNKARSIKNEIDRSIKETGLDLPNNLVPMDAAMSPLCEIVPLGPVRAFICHGHSYHVKYSLDSLVYAAQEQQAKIAMFGHTHMPFNEDIDGVRVINPGSAGMGRKPSFALVEVFDNSGIYCEIKEL